MSEWRVVELPAIAEEGDAAGREVGEALWPERYPIEALHERCRDVGGEGSRAWQALYQQRPVPPSGAMFRASDFRYYEGGRGGVFFDGAAYDVDDAPVGMTVDTALKEREENDWTAVLLFMVLGPDALILILDVIRERLQVPDQWPVVRDAWRRWGPDRFGIEDRGSGTGLIQQCGREGIPVEELRSPVDKVTRAAPISEWYRARRVLHPIEAPWLEAYERELRSFPHGRHDDQVDAAAYARYLSFTMTPGMGRPLAAPRRRDRALEEFRPELPGLPEGFLGRRATARGAVASKYGYDS